MNGKAVACLLAALLLPPLLPAVGAADTVISGDLTVSSAVTFSGNTTTLQGNLTVAAGGALTLDNATLLIDSASPGEHWLEVQTGGLLVLVNGSTVRPASAGLNYTMVVRAGGQLRVSGSALRGCGYGDPATWRDSMDSPGQFGPFIEPGGFATVENSTLENFVGLAVKGTPAQPTIPVIDNATVSGGVAGLLVTGGSLQLTRSTLTRNSDFGLAISGAPLPAAVAGTNLTLNGAGLYIVNSTVVLQGSTIRDNGYAGALLEGGRLYANDSMVATPMGGRTLRLGNASVAETVNVQMAPGSWLFEDAASYLNRSWYLSISSSWQNSAPVRNGRYSVRAATGLWAANGTLPNGTTERPEALLETSLRSGGETRFTPYNITVNRSGVTASVQHDLTASTAVAVTLNDTSAPAAGFTTPASTPVWVNATAVDVEGFARDNVEVEYMELSIDGVTAGAPSHIPGWGQWSAPLTLVEGNHTVNATARDPAGNTGTASVTVVVDTRPPSLNLSQPAFNITNTTRVPLKGTTENGAEVTIEVDGNRTVLPNSGGLFEGAVNLTREGPNRLFVEARDRAGNRAGVERIIVLDTAAPNITILSPAGGTQTNQPSVTVTGRAEPGMALVAGGNATVADAGGNFSVEVQLPGFVEGPYTITVEGADVAGNTGRASVMLVLDHIAPVVTLQSMPKFTNGYTLLIEGRASETATVTVNGESAAVAPSGNFSLLVSLIEGQNRVVVVSADAAGNGNTTTYTVTRDTIAPYVDILSPKSGSTSADGVMQVNLSVSDTNLARVYVRTDGAESPCTVTGTNGTCTVELREGLNRITAVALDLAGNERRAEAVVTYAPAIPDRTPPQITVFLPAGTVTGSRVFSLSGTATDDRSVAGVWFSTDNRTWQNATMRPTPRGMDWNATVTLADGLNTFYLMVQDGGGKVTIERAQVRYSPPVAQEQFTPVVWLLVFLVFVVLSLAGYGFFRRDEARPVPPKPVRRVVVEEPEYDEDVEYECPLCGAGVGAAESKCPKCGVRFDEDESEKRRVDKKRPPEKGKTGKGSRKGRGRGKGEEE